MIIDQPQINGTAQGRTSLAVQRTTRPHYLYAHKAITQGLVGTGTDIVFNQVVASGLSLTSNTIVNLTGGKVYKITVNLMGLDFSLGTSGWVVFDVVNNATNAAEGASQAALFPQSSTTGETNNQLLDMILQPASNIGIKIRCTAANGTASIRGGFCSLTITEII